MEVLNLKCDSQILKNSKTSLIVPYKRGGVIMNDGKIKKFIGKRKKKLNCTLQPWIPSKIKRTNNMVHNVDDDDDDEFLKNIQCIVNKITLENMNELTKNMKSLQINNCNKLHKTVDIIMNLVGRSYNKIIYKYIVT